MKDSTRAVEAPVQDDFARTPVPDHGTASTWHIAMIVVGTIIGIPVFLSSAQIGGTMGLKQALPAFMVGSLILCILGMLTSLAGAMSRFSAYMLTEFAFGRSGAKFVNLVIAVTLVGWYGVTGNLFGQAADLAIRETLGWSLPLSLYVIVGSVLMITIAIVGFKGIDKLAFVLVPLMMLFLGYTNWLTLDQLPAWGSDPGAGGSMSFSVATSSVVGGYIVGVVIQPDYSRFARNARQALFAMVIALGLVYPLVQVLAAIPSIATGEVQLIQIMIALGIGVPAFLLMLLASWSSNVVGLYSASLSLSTIFTRSHLATITMVAGTLGTALALSHAQSLFIPFLVLLGIAIPPVAAVYIIDVLLVRRGRCEVKSLESEPAIDWAAFAAWGLGTGTGALTGNSVLVLSGIAALDSLLVASLFFAVCRWRRIVTAWKKPQPICAGGT